MTTNRTARDIQPGDTVDGRTVFSTLYRPSNDTVHLVLVIPRGTDDLLNGKRSYRATDLVKP